MNQENLPLKNVKNLKINQYFIQLKKSIFKDKTVSIFGGGDSALDWAVELSKDSKVNLIHRRDEFRGAQSTVEKMNELKKVIKLIYLQNISLKSVMAKKIWKVLI